MLLEIKALNNNKDTTEITEMNILKTMLLEIQSFNNTDTKEITEMNSASVAMVSLSDLLMTKEIASIGH